MKSISGPFLPGPFVLDPSGRRVRLHDAAGFARLRAAGRVAAACLDHLAPAVRPGISTGDLDGLVADFLGAQGALAATLGYRGFPKSCCISVNDEVNHGIPSPARRLADGDIVNVDVTAIVEGWYGDTSRMYLVGAVAPAARRLVDATWEATMAGVMAVRPGGHLGDIGHAVETVARRCGYSTVRDYVGHGIGQVFHDAPQVLHWGNPGTGMRLLPGMVFTVEPMLNIGGPAVRTLPDRWTNVTVDGSLSAQFEHMVGVTDTGVEIFTLSPAGHERPPYPGGPPGSG
nr:type I methionyl aminopeptidase [Oleisolibacter albus]